MVIRRMNSVFHRHGRVVFSLFTILIIVTFVGFFTPGFRSLFTGGGGSQLVGVIFGRNITYPMLRDQAKLERLSLALQSGLPLDKVLGSSMLSDRAWNGAFSSLAQMEAAKKCGIRISDKQVANYIAGLAVMKDAKGNFDMQRYRAQLKVLHKQGFSAQDLDSAVRCYLMRKAYSLQVDNAVVITDNELRNFYNFLMGKCFLKVRRFNAVDYLGKVKVSDQEVKDYFEKNHQFFTMPAEYKAELVVFPVKKFTVAAAKQITPEKLKTFYKNNRNNFKTPQGKMQPFSQVKSAVKADLTRSIAMGLARDAAQMFATDLYDMLDMVDDADRYKAFSDKLKKKKLSTIKSDWFKSTDRQVGRIVSPTLVKQIAMVDDEMPVSNAVAVDDAVYVAYRLDKHPKRPAKLAEVKGLIVKELKMRKARLAAEADARKLAQKIMQAKNPAALVNAKTSGFTAVAPFSRKNLPYGKLAELVPEAEKLPAGKISQPIATASGSAIIYVVKRVPPDPKGFAKAKRMVKFYYSMSKVRIAQQSANQWINSNCKYLNNGR